MNRCGAFGFAFVSLVWVVASARATGTPAQGCAAAKLTATGKVTAAMLGCHANATRHGVAVDSLCVAKARTKLTSRIASLETRGGCATPGDASSITVILDSNVGAFVTALRPTTTANRCAATKLKATGKKAKAKLRCYGKATRVGGGVDAACLTKAEAQFSAAFAAAEHSPTCLTTHDADDVESTVDDFVGEVVAAIPSDTTTTTSSTSTTTIVTAPSTTTTTNPTCLGHGELGRCSADFPCCGADVCEVFVCGGSAGGSGCTSCIPDFGEPGGFCYYGGCTKDADCCTAGHRCFVCGGFAGLCGPPESGGCP